MGRGMEGGLRGIEGVHWAVIGWEAFQGNGGKGSE